MTWYINVLDAETGEFDLVDGDLDGLYPTLDFSVLPTLSEEAYNEWCQKGNQYTRFLDGRLVYQQPAIDEVQRLIDIRSAKLSAINAAAQAYINRASGADLLPAYEVQSWPLQALEAKAWQADPTAATPILDGIAAARGGAADTLKAAALRKTLAYEAVCARVAGRRQALQTAVEKAKTVADIDAVAVDFDEDASA